MVEAGIDDIGNAILLRYDIQLLLDRHDLVFYPGPSLNPEQPKKFHAIVTKRYEYDYARLLHRRQLQMPEHVCDEFLYARFAYAIIKSGRSKAFKTFPIPEAVQDFQQSRKRARHDSNTSS